MAKNSPPQVVKISRSFIDKHRAILEEHCFPKLGIELRLNTRTNSLEVQREGGAWRRLEDYEESSIKEKVAEKCFIEKATSNDLRPVRLSGENWKTALEAIVHSRQFDPFLVWLEDLPPWDGEARLKSLLSTCFNTQGTPQEILEFASYAPLVAAIKRAKHPGWKYDHMIVLQGPEGCGKSTYWKELLPDSEYFSDSLDFGASEKKKAEELQGKVIIESAELRGMSRAELNSLKAFITRNSDFYRPSYGKRAKDHKRRCVLVGSTNYDECLPNDPAGNRRFLVVKVGPAVEENAREIKTLLDGYREQIWAEALVLEKENAPIHISGKLKHLQAETNEAFRSRPNESLEETLLQFLENNAGKKLPILEIETVTFQLAKIQNPTFADKGTLKSLLYKHGVERKRDAQGKRFWVIPGLNPDTTDTP